MIRSYQGPRIRERAPAKLNLALHVTGRRPDGLHRLDSLVAFADVADVVEIAPGDGLQVGGPFAADLCGGGNLCRDAAQMMDTRVAITLTKNLPVASGLGGGSTDAAAVLRALVRAGWVLPDEDDLLVLGADVPACLRLGALRMRGVGEVLDPVTLPAGLHPLLVNPGVPVSTADVFAMLASRDNPGLPPLPPGGDVDAWLAWLRDTRNDLETPACGLVPAIGNVLDALGHEGALFRRMSGSGATCFGLFASAGAAAAAGRRIAQARPGWWVRATALALDAPTG